MGERFKTSELDPAEVAPVAATSAPAPSAAPALGSPVGNFWEGLKKSGLDTVQGAQQLKAYAMGTPEEKEALNKAIREAENNPALDTWQGKLGYVVGTVGTFALPGGIITKGAAALPKLAAAAPKVVAAARAFSAPATIPEAIAGSAAFEASRPTSVPEGNIEPGALIQGRGLQTVGGGVGGGIGGTLIKGIGAFAKPLMGAAKSAAEEIVATAERAGFPKLLPSQIRKTPLGDIITEGAKITPGASGPVRDILQPQAEFVQQAAAKAIGSPATKVTGPVIEEAWDKALAAGYEPIAKNVQQIIPTGIEKRYFERIGKGGGYATPEAQAAARIVSKDVTGSQTAFSGDRIIDRLQYFRNLMSNPNINESAKEEIGLLQKDFESWAKRATERRYGPQAKMWFDKLDESRKALSEIRRVREATDIPTETFNPGRFARRDVKGSPGRAAGTQTGPLAPLAEISRLSEIIKSPIGSSGTTERWMGSRVLNALALPLGGAALAPLTGQDYSTGAGEGVAALLGARGIGRAITSDILRRNAIRGFPKINWMAERMGLPATALGEAIRQ